MWKNISNLFSGKLGDKYMRKQILLTIITISLLLTACSGQELSEIEAGLAQASISGNNAVSEELVDTESQTEMLNEQINAAGIARVGDITIPFDTSKYFAEYNNASGIENLYLFDRGNDGFIYNAIVLSYLKNTSEKEITSLQDAIDYLDYGEDSGCWKEYENCYVEAYETALDVNEIYKMYFILPKDYKNTGLYYMYIPYYGAHDVTEKLFETVSNGLTNYFGEAIMGTYDETMAAMSALAKDSQDLENITLEEAIKLSGTEVIEKPEFPEETENLAEEESSEPEK